MATTHHWMKGSPMKRKCTVLRTRRRPNTREPFATASLLAIGASHHEESHDTKVDVDELSPSDLQSLARDPSVTAVAPVMPTKLLRPLAVNPTTAAANAWGVSEVRAHKSSFDGDG